VERRGEKMFLRLYGLIVYLELNIQPATPGMFHNPCQLHTPNRSRIVMSSIDPIYEQGALQRARTRLLGEETLGALWYLLVTLVGLLAILWL